MYRIANSKRLSAWLDEHREQVCTSTKGRPFDDSEEEVNVLWTCTYPNGLEEVFVVVYEKVPE